MLFRKCHWETLKQPKALNSSLMYQILNYELSWQLCSADVPPQPPEPTKHYEPHPEHVCCLPILGADLNNYCAIVGIVVNHFWAFLGNIGPHFSVLGDLHLPPFRPTTVKPFSAIVVNHFRAFLGIIASCCQQLSGIFHIVVNCCETFLVLLQLAVNQFETCLGSVKNRCEPLLGIVADHFGHCWGLLSVVTCCEPFLGICLHFWRLTRYGMNSNF